MDAASIVSAWEAVTLPLAFAFTGQTARTGPQIVTGWVLPAVFALYRKRSDCNADHRFATHARLACQMIGQVRDAWPDVMIRAAADGAFATRQMVAGLPTAVNLVSRIRRDAGLYALPPKRRPKGQRGRAWFAKAAPDEPQWRPEAPPWNPATTRPSLADIIAALRRVLWLDRISSLSARKGRVRGILKAITQALFAAA